METHDSSEAIDEQPNGALTTQPRSGQSMRRDFAGTMLAVTSAATDALVAKARADVEARWIMAMRMPRNLDDVRQCMLRECKRPGFADVATYARPVGNKKNERTGEWEQAFAEGLSIRFAEMAARAMGNMQPDVQTIFDDDRLRIVRVTVTDFESNVTWSKDLSIRKTVERKQLKKGQRSLQERTNSYGDRVFVVEATDDEVAVKEAAQVSKAARTLILRMVPGHLQDEMFDLCKQVSADKQAKDPNAARVRLLDAFASVGVMPSDLEQYLGHTTERLAPAELEVLRKIYASINTGEASWQEIIDSGPKASPIATPAQPAPVDAKAPQTATPSVDAGATRNTSTGKGAAALKAQLKPEPAPQVVVPDVIPGEVAIYPCKDCGGPIEGPAELRGEAKCEACANS